MADLGLWIYLLESDYDNDVTHQEKGACRHLITNNAYMYTAQFHINNSR